MIHITQPNHVDSFDCWCQPFIFDPCVECEGFEPACWKCGGDGMLFVPPEELEAANAEKSLVCVHRDDEETLEEFLARMKRERYAEMERELAEAPEAPLSEDEIDALVRRVVEDEP